MADTKVPCDDRTGTDSNLVREPASDDAGKAPEGASRTDAERELSERVRRKIKSISSKTKRYLN